MDLLETCVLNGIYQGLMVGYKRIECLNELELPERDFPRPRSVRGGEKMSKALSRVMTWEGRIDKHSAYQEDVDVFGWALGDVLPPIPKDARVRVGRSESTEDKLSENRKTLSTQRYDHFGRTWNTETWSEVQRLQETISRSPRVELRVWEKEDSLSFLPDS